MPYRKMWRWCLCRRQCRRQVRTRWLSPMSTYKISHENVTSRCDEDTDCLSGTCVNGTCSALKANNVDCTQDSECTSNHCVDLGTSKVCSDGNVGDACTSSDPNVCSSGFCGASNTCELAPLDYSCTAASQCESGFCAGDPKVCSSGGQSSPCLTAEKDCAVGFSCVSGEW